MTSLDALLEAAQFLEHRNTPGSKARAAGDSKTNQASSESGSSPVLTENGMGEGLPQNMDLTDDDPNKGKRPGGHGTREVHNKLEKNRRAHLKECFENLRLQIPNMEDKKTSNLAILRQAVKHINLLKRKEKEMEVYMQHMAREKIMMQEKIVVLKQELQELNVDVDLASFLKSIQDTDNHSESTASAANDQPILSDEENDPNHVPTPIICVTVEDVSSPAQVFVNSQTKTSSPATIANLLKAEAKNEANAHLPTVIPGGSPSKPAPLSITSPAVMNVSRFIVPTSTPNTSSPIKGSTSTLTLFDTSTAGQPPPQPVVSMALPSVVVQATSSAATAVINPGPTTTTSIRPPVTQILQQQLAQRQQAKIQKAAAAQQQVVLQNAAGIPQLITLNANTIQGLAPQTNNQNNTSGGITLKSVSLPSGTVPSTTINLAQLPLLNAGSLRLPASSISGLTTLNQANTATIRPAAGIQLSQLFPQLAAGNQAATVLSLTPQTSAVASSMTPTLYSITPQGQLSVAGTSAPGVTSVSAASNNASAQALASIGKLVSSVSNNVPTSMAITLAPAPTTAQAALPAAQPTQTVNLGNLGQMMPAQLITTAQLQQLLNQQTQKITLAAPPTVNVQTTVPSSTVAPANHTVLTAGSLLTPASAASILTSANQPQARLVQSATQLMAPMTVLNAPGVQLASNSGVSGLTQAQLQAQLLKQLTTGQIPLLTQQPLTIPLLTGNKPLIMVSGANIVSGSTSAVTNAGNQGANQQPVTWTLAAPPVSKS